MYDVMPTISEDSDTHPSDNDGKTVEFCFNRTFFRDFPKFCVVSEYSVFNFANLFSKKQVCKVKFSRRDKTVESQNERGRIFRYILGMSRIFGLGIAILIAKNS